MNTTDSPAKSSTTTTTETQGRSTLGFRVIGAMKIGSGLMLVLAGFGIFRALHSDLGEMIERYVVRLHLDPENRLIQEALTRIEGIKPAQLRLIGVGTFFYAGLHFVEGIGLILLKRWAEYFTVIMTGSLLPLEVYEIARHVSPIRIAVLLVNVGIVAYLIYKLRQDHKDRKETRAGATASP